MLKLPVGIIAVTRPFSSTHSGLDLGWVNENNKKIYSAEDGIVNFAGKLNDGCLLIAIYHKSLKTLTIYAHCSIMLVKKGDIIVKGQYIGYMGSTGNSTAVHLHYEVWNNIPDNFQYNPSTRDRDSKKYRVNPLSVTYCYDDQKVLEGSIKYITKYIKGTPIERNTNIDQLEVKIDILNARSTPNGAILGLTNKGIYNILSITKNGLYDWYEIEKDLFVAYSKDWENLLPKEESELDKAKATINELTLKNSELSKQVDLLANECRKQTEIIKQVNDLTK